MGKGSVMSKPKLVRDKIPYIIENSGKIPVTRILGDEEYTACLHRKLDEEVAEFHQDKNGEELADLLEVVYALAADLGISREMLMEIYAQKHEARGGFSRRIYLEDITDKCL
jgi:predicted house-cleaning noncanonical NTP pyrophosphatase (MazG superfamily)